MNTENVTSTYQSPLREAQKEETRRRILDAAVSLIENADPAGLSFAAIAKAAGIQERTVYRHFPTKEALIEQLWSWLDPRIGIGSFPESEADLIAFPKRVFAAFDDNENLTRAMWMSPQGREFRLKVNDRRKAAIRKSVADAVKGLPRKEAAAITAAAQLLYSGASWVTMKDYWGFTGKEAGDAASLAIEMLLDAARKRSAEGDKS